MAAGTGMVTAAALVTDMLKLLGEERVFHKDVDLKTYTYDSSFVSQINDFTPEVVVMPTSTEEVSRIMRYADEHGVAVTPRGAGSGQTGGSVAVRGGIVMDLSAWNDIVEVDEVNMQVVVRPGVVHADLNNHIASYGLYFPPDPGSSEWATIGGMVANNASGLRAVKYGNTGQYVLGLEVVMPDGQVIRTGGLKSKALKSVSGLNLTGLFLASEGTLGVITEVRLKVWPKPPSRAIVVAYFDRLEDAAQSVLEVFKAGILPSGIEILDDGAIRSVNLFKPQLKLPEVEAAIFFEVNGSKAATADEGRQIEEIAKKRAGSVEMATDPKRMKELWTGRQAIGAASARAKPNAARIFAGEDVCFPMSKVPEALRRIKEIGREHDTMVVIYGHIGDGNMHTAPIIDPLKPEEVEAAQRVAEAIHRLALEIGGATTGEHGVGFVRAAFMEEEHGAALEVMRRIKDCMDPKGIMNPGKIWAGEE